MAYLREHEWEKGQTITAEKLNHMEKGIAAALGAIKSAFGTDYTDGSDKYEVSLGNLGNDTPINAGAISGTTLTASSDLTVDGTSNLKGKLTVGAQDISGGTDTELWGKLTINGREQTDSNNNIIKPAAILDGTLTVSGATTLKDILRVTKKTTLKDDLEVTKNTTLEGTLSVTGNSTINGELTAGTSTTNDSTTTYSGNTTLYGDVSIYNSSDKYTKIYGSLCLPQPTSFIFLGNYSNPRISLNAYDGSVIANRLQANYLSINYPRTGTVVFNTLTNELHGTTTIDKLDKLIVGDSTSTEDNEIYGFTTISNLTVSDLTAGAPNVGSPRETQTYSGIATFNTEENFLHGHTTIDYLTTLKVLSADEAHWIHGDLTLGTQVLRPNNENPELSSQTTEDNLKINSRNITIGLQSTSEYPSIVDNSSLTIYAETSMVGTTEIQNLEYLNVTGNSNNFITGSTIITNLIVPSFVIRDQTSTNGGYSFTINNGTNLRLSQNNNNNNNFDFYFKDTGELIFSGAGYFDNTLTLKNNLIFETESSNQSTSYNYIIKPSLSSANHYSLQMNINKGTSDVHTILTYYDNTEDQILYLGNSVSNNTMSSTVTSLFLEAKNQIVLQSGEGNGVEVDSNLYLQSGKELRLAKSNTQNDYVILTATQLEQIKNYCNITD